MHRFPAMLAAIALFVAAPVFAASPQALAVEVESSA